MNEYAVAGCSVAGEGLFMTGAHKRLMRSGIHVPATEYDLIAVCAASTSDST
ncbi:MAG: hypothetical protein WAN22_29420 [Solirubrobacteraceae bacterium]